MLNWDRKKREEEFNIKLKKKRIGSMEQNQSFNPKQIPSATCRYFKQCSEITLK